MQPAQLTLGRLGRWSRGSAERPWDASSRLGLAFACAALTLGLGAVYPGFLSVDNMLVTLLSVTSIGVVAFGTAALLISGNVDLSIGGQYAFIGMVTGIVARDTQSTMLAIVTGLVVGAGLGQLNGRLVRWLRINPLIVTLGMATILHGLAFVLSGGVSVFGFPGKFVTLGQTYLGRVPLPVVVGAVVFIVGSIVLLRTVGGLRTYAIGGSPSAAKLSGINTERYVTGLYTFNGALVGLVAVMSVARLGSASPNVGIGFELEVLTAVILGGVAFTGGSGHPFGVFVGVFTIGILNAGVVFAGVADFWQQVVQGTALLVALGADQFAAYRRARRRHGSAVEEPPRSGATLPTLGSEEEGDAGATPQARGEGRTVVLSCRELKKYYGSVLAVSDVSLSVAEGEILCLAGDNGAGKSTVIKMLSGALQPDGGVIEFRGRPIKLTQPADAQSLGIATAYQELALCPNLGVAENLTLGQEPTRTRWGVFSWRDDRAAEREAEERLAELSIALRDYRQPVRLLSGGQRQSVAIARAADRGASVVILDEPTAALGRRQTESVLKLVRLLAREGLAVVVITHDVETILELADHVVVLRLGKVSFDGPRQELTQSGLIHLMAGFPATMGADSAPVRVARESGGLR